MITTKQIMDSCNGNVTLAASYLRVHRNTARRLLSEEKLIVVDGNVYKKIGTTRDSALNANRRKVYEQYLDLVQSVLTQTNSTRETADLMCEHEPGKKRNEEKVQWVRRIDRWITEGKLVV